MSLFHLELDPRAARLRLSGEVDLAQSPRLRRALDRVVDAGPACRVDLADVTFADVAAIRELLRGQDRALERGSCLFVVAPDDPAVLQPFDAIGVLDGLDFVARDAATS